MQSPELRRILRNRARDLRRDMTITEVILWQNLRRDVLGVRFRRQHPIGPFIADFAAVRPKLVVEADGSSHEMREDDDAARDRFMTSRGWTVLRFSDHDISTDWEGVVDTIYGALESRGFHQPEVASSRRGLGG